MDDLHRLSDESRAEIMRLQEAEVGQAARTATLERANADLHSRLDELRRAVACFGNPLVRVSATPPGIVGKSFEEQFREAERRRATTASGRLAEHLPLSAKTWPPGSVGAEQGLSRDWLRRDEGSGTDLTPDPPSS